MLASMKDSASSKMSVLSGLSDLSDVSGITELKNQLRAKENYGEAKMIWIDENEELEFDKGYDKKETEVRLTNQDLEKGYSQL